MNKRGRSEAVPATRQNDLKSWPNDDTKNFLQMTTSSVQKAVWWRLQPADQINWSQRAQRPRADTFH